MAGKMVCLPRVVAIVWSSDVATRCGGHSAATPTPTPTPTPTLTHTHSPTHLHPQLHPHPHTTHTTHTTHNTRSNAAKQRDNKKKHRYGHNLPDTATWLHGRSTTWRGSLLTCWCRCRAGSISPLRRNERQLQNEGATDTKQWSETNE